jgi:alkylation response protein AidB-like acyl-CoA dehydrogenase
MADFVSDIRDIKFVLFEQLDIDKLIAFEKYSEFAREDMEMILDEAYKLAREVLGPINEEMDRQGCTYDPESSKVTVPASMHEPYTMFNEGGWASLSKNPEYGGGGAPECLMMATCDIFFGANISFNLGALLTTGAAHLIEAFGTDELKNTYCEKMYSGEWAGTMCLTESQAGSDVGASTTKAIPTPEGHYLIEGEKIFITFGDHDLTENIVHAVLARIEGAPKGTKGISLFAVPKYRVDADGSLGDFNDVVCSGIEHKLGIHGSPTCTMVFGQNGGCHGYLLGEEHKGMRAMFQMMNEARISVGEQGSAMANAAYQAALVYTKERLQGPDIKNFKDPDAPKVPIIRHADVQMMLMKQKAYCEGMRSMLLATAYSEDRAQAAKAAGDEKAYERWEGLVEIMTPICKAYCSDMGFRMTEIALQCYGGYGYIKEYPAEQYLRDCKIASIYEGTNGIQAMDLVARKLSLKGGAYLMALAGLVNRFIDANKEHPVLAKQVAALAEARNAWGAVNGFFMASAAQKKLMVPLVNATNYLSLCGDLMLGCFLIWQAAVAWEKLQPLCKEAGVDPADARALSGLARENPEVRFYDGKLKTARYFCSYELPQVQAKAAAIKSGDMSAIHMVWEDE